MKNRPWSVQPKCHGATVSRPRTLLEMSLLRWQLLCKPEICSHRGPRCPVKHKICDWWRNRLKTPNRTQIRQSMTVRQLATSKVRPQLHKASAQDIAKVPGLTFDAGSVWSSENLFRYTYEMYMYVCMYVGMYVYIYTYIRKTYCNRTYITYIAHNCDIQFLICEAGHCSDNNGQRKGGQPPSRLLSRKHHHFYESQPAG
jgi:hypothetical protein